MPIRVYADRSHYREDQRKHLVDIVKAQWNDRSPDERRRVYGRMAELFVVVERPEDADLCVLTNYWNYYVDTDQIGLAHRAVQAARRAGRLMAIFSGGDFTANVPWPDVHVFEASTYRSRAGRTVHAMPPLFADTAAAWFGGAPPLRPWSPRPVVGFCGQAGGTPRDFLERRVKNLARRLMYRAGLLRWEPTPFEHTILRKRVLDTLRASPAVACNFVIRDQYRAGLEQVDKGDVSRRKSEQEFVDNLVGADYTVCVRGGGNWSKRFYESLCVGRPPLLVDTDCLLPFPDQIDWRRHAVIVDVAELARAPEAVAAYHAQLGPEAFAERQRACRQLWLDWLTRDGFYTHFHEHFASFVRR
jgi:hypothetical protein